MGELDVSLGRAFGPERHPESRLRARRAIWAMARLVGEAEVELDAPIASVTLLTRVIEQWALGTTNTDPVIGAWEAVGAELWSRESEGDQRVLYLAQSAWHLGRSVRAYREGQLVAALNRANDAGQRLVWLAAYDGVLLRDGFDKPIVSPYGRHVPDWLRFDDSAKNVSEREALQRREEVDMILALRLEDLLTEALDILPVAPEEA